MITDPPVRAARFLRPNSRVMNQVPVRVVSSTARQAFGDMSSAGTGKLAAALFTSTPGSPAADSAASNAPATCSGSLMSHTALTTRPPSAASSSRALSSRPASRPTMTSEAPSRANSAAIAFPSPEPPPVTITVLSA